MFASTLPRPFGLGTGDVPWNHLWSDDIVQPATFTRTQPTRPRTNAHAPRRQSRLLFDLPLFQGLRDRVLLCPGGGRGGMRIKRSGQGNDRTLLDGQGCHSVTQSARHSAGSQNPGLINWRWREYTNTCINTYIYPPLPLPGLTMASLLSAYTGGRHPLQIFPFPPIQPQA